MTTPWQQVAAYGGVPVLLHDSVQVFDPRAAGAVVVSGSHTGGPASLHGAAIGARALIGNDAGGGKDGAGTAGLGEVERYRVAAAAVAHDSARIGDGEDTYRHGVISLVNRWAAESGVRPGQPAATGARLLAGWDPGPDRELPDAGEAHRTIVYREQPLRIVAVDSASQIGPELVGAIVFTGSHGGAVGGVGVKAAVAAAFFNDAGVGKDSAGQSRLPIMDTLGIPGATVSNDTARIGYGDETYRSGVLSAVNEAAVKAGLTVGMPAREAGDVLMLVLRDG